MMHVMRAADVIGLPVVSIATGEDIAEIRDVIYDAADHRLLGFTLNKRGILSGRRRDELPASSARGVGRDAVMVDAESAITETADIAEEAGRSERPVHVIGNRVLSMAGAEIGTVIGVIISAGSTSEAVGYEIEPSEGGDRVFIPISEQLALSGENLLLPDEAAPFVRNDLAGFGAAVESYRNSTLGSPAAARSSAERPPIPEGPPTMDHPASEPPPPPGASGIGRNDR